MCCRAIKTKFIEGAVIAYQSLLRAEYIHSNSQTKKMDAIDQCDQIWKKLATLAKFRTYITSILCKFSMS